MFLTIGERINATRKKVAAALENKDADFIRGEIGRQLEGGADMIDLNGGASPESELENMVWLTEVAASACDAPLCIDSAQPEVIQAAMKTYLDVREERIPEEFETARNRPWLMVNSINSENARYDSLLPLVREYNCAVVALCMESARLDTDIEARARIGAELVERLAGDGIEPERIYLDPLVMPVGVDTGNALNAIELIQRLKHRFPGLRSVCGLSNISFGMPRRGLLNRTLLVMLVSADFDAAVMDTSDRKLMSSLYAALALCGKDKHCSEYISAFRRNRLEE